MLIDILDGALQIAANLLVGAITLTVGLSLLILPGYIIGLIFPSATALLSEQFAPVVAHGVIGLMALGLLVALFSLGIVIRGK